MKILHECCMKTVLRVIFDVEFDAQIHFQISHKVNHAYLVQFRLSTKENTYFEARQ